jgi:hypothetical protein
VLGGGRPGFRSGGGDQRRDGDQRRGRGGRRARRVDPRYLNGSRLRVLHEDRGHRRSSRQSPRRRRAFSQFSGILQGRTAGRPTGRSAGDPQQCADGHPSRPHACRPSQIGSFSRRQLNGALGRTIRWSRLDTLSAGCRLTRS